MLLRRVLRRHRAREGLQKICDAILGLLENFLTTKATTGDEGTLPKRKGDRRRCIAESSEGDEKIEAAKSSASPGGAFTLAGLGLAAVAASICFVTKATHA